MKHLNLFLLFAFLLTSCTPAATIAPTQTAISTSTLTPVPPTITPTPAPENLADASDLPTWIEQYVNAYGGQVTVNGVNMNTAQLTTAIKSNPDSFTQTKQINGIEYSFLVVNGIPLVARDMNGKWSDATIVNLLSVLPVGKNIQSATGVYSEQLNDPYYTKLVKEIATQVVIQQDTNINRVFKYFTADDWKKITDDGNWGIIQQELSEGMLPDLSKLGLPNTYDFSGADKIVEFSKTNNLQIRAQHLIWGNDQLPSIINGNFTNEQLQKILEFTVKSRVLKYKGKIDEWSIDELALTMKWHKNDGWTFWIDKLGKDIILDVVKWAKETDPNIKIVVTEYTLTEKDQATSHQPIFDFLKWLKDSHAAVDKYDDETNLWIGEPFDAAYSKAQLEKVTSLGYEIATPEITISKAPTWYNDKYRVPNVPIPSTEIERQRMQAAMWKSVTSFYISNFSVFGVGGVREKESWIRNEMSDKEASALLIGLDNEKTESYYQVLWAIYNIDSK